MANTSTDMKLRLVIEALDKSAAGLKTVQANLRNMQGNLQGAARGVSGIGGVLNQTFGNIGRGAQNLQGLLGGGLTGALTNATGGFGSMALAIGGAGAAITGLLAGSMALRSALSQIVNFLQQSRLAWETQRIGSQRLEAVWRSMGRSTPTDAIKEYAGELQKLSNYGDEQIITATRILATFPQITDDLMKDAMQTMVDFAAFADTSLDQAANMVGKAAMGMVGALQRVGVTISEDTKRSGNFVDILREMNQQIGGQALASANKITQVKNAFGDVQEQIGRILETAYAPALEPILEKLVELQKRLQEAIDAGEFDDFIEKLGELADIAKDIILALIDVIVDLAKEFKEAVESDEFIPYLRSLTDSVIEASKYTRELIHWMRVLFNVMSGDVPETIQLLFGKKAGAPATPKAAETPAKASVTGSAELAATTKAQAKKDLKEFKQAVEEVKNQYELLQRMTEADAAIRRGQIDLELAQRKMAITERTQSEILATEQITAAEIEASQKRIQAVIDEHAETRRIREQAYQALKEQLEKDLKNESKRAETQKKLRDLEHKHAQERIQDAQKVTEAINRELEKQAEKRAELLKKVQTLNDQIRDVESETAEHLRQVNQAGMDEYARLADNLNQAQAKLKQAADLMPSFPERALKLAKDAQQAFTSLIQNTASLRQQMSSDIGLIYNALRSLKKVGMPDTQRWKADMQDVLVLLNEARRLGAAGKTKEAQQLYRQVVSKAEQLGTSAPEGMKRTGAAQAEGLVKQAGKELMLLNEKSIKDAEGVNKQAAEGIQSAGDLMVDEIAGQIKSIEYNIQALDRNTQALQGLREAIGKREETTKTAEETKAKPPAREEAPPRGVPLGEARQRMVMETEAPSGPTPEEQRKQREAIEAAPLFGETEKELSRVEKRYQELFPEGAGAGMGAPLEAITGADAFADIGGALQDALGNLVGSVQDRIDAMHEGVRGAAESIKAPETRPPVEAEAGERGMAVEAGAKLDQAVTRFETIMDRFDRTMEKATQLRVTVNAGDGWD